MNAKEAREITHKNLTNIVNEQLMVWVNMKIKEAAQKGLSIVNNPLTGIKGYPSEDEKELLWKELTRRGYKVVHHPDPDPGHPCSSPYTSVSW